MTSATSRAAIGDVRLAPNSNQITSYLAIDRVARAMNSGFSMNTVGRMCTTGSPAQFNSCSAESAAAAAESLSTVEFEATRCYANPMGMSQMTVS